MLSLKSWNTVTLEPSFLFEQMEQIKENIAKKAKGNVKKDYYLRTGEGPIVFTTEKLLI